MPAINASGILRCCRGAHRLLEEKRKRERAEEEKRAQHRAHGSADDAPHPKPGQTDAAVPPNSDKCEETGCPMSPVVGDMGSGCPIVCCERSADGAKSNGSAVTGDMNASASADEPQPWNLERPLPVLPPPQFADGREKFQCTVERLSSRRLEAILRRDRALRAHDGCARLLREPRPGRPLRTCTTPGDQRCSMEEQTGTTMQ